MQRDVYHSCKLVPWYILDSSIVAVCTPGEHDDTAMLVYWIVSGTFNYMTEFIDEIKGIFPAGGEHWYEFEFFIVLWFLLPFTDGAALLYDKIIEPYVAPVAKKLATKVEGWIAVILTIVNTSYLSFAWWVFMFLPEGMRRFMVVVVGTVYPIAASTVAVATRTDGQDDTFWLTYWSCFSILFVAMDYLENFIGSIPGFYSLCMAASKFPMVFVFTFILDFRLIGWVVDCPLKNLSC
jgi:TB2/DP1, HVA22 family